MTMQQAVISCFRKYAVFQGRAPRAEFWWFTLFCLIVSTILSMVENMINAIMDEPNGPTILSGSFALATIIPNLAVGWRRMHDMGRSGLSLLYPLIIVMGIMMYLSVVIGPDALAAGEIQTSGISALILFVAAIALLVSPLLVIWWLTRPSQPGANEYGPNPYGDGS